MRIAARLERFAFVLFRPKFAGNVGSVARVLKNMGLADLRLVAPMVFDRRAAAAMAVHAKDVLDSARTFQTLVEAVADCTLTIGTTCRAGPYRKATRPLREALSALAAEVSREKVAVIFGPEDTGLTNRELKLCHRLITIPTAPEYASLNLAQAAALVAYELRMAFELTAAKRLPAASGDDVHACAAEVDAMLERMAQALVAIGFLPADNPDHIMFAVRALYSRTRLSPRELDILNGIARHVKWFAEGGREVIEGKRRAGLKAR